MFRSLLVVIIASVLVACERLPANVKIHKSSNGCVNLVAPRSGVVQEVVSGDIKRVRAKGGMIFGYKVSFQYADGVTSKGGCFVLDTRTWELREGLTEAELKRLESKTSGKAGGLEM